ncbi:metal-dependent hydrolase [Micromonospora sp. NPDC005173]|uniref:metal-dependent hydrolase n=1 Tax=Micromonospora sp. NPDC005173 TaxID=3157165 RepID=UPI0033AD997A
MMGKSHALSGAVAWLAVCAGAEQAAAAGLGVPDPGAAAVVVGAATAAGYALLPDIDHPQSTIARALGPITGALAWASSRGAAALRRAGCAHCADGPDRGGHRAVTHTAVFAAVLGAVLAVIGWHFGAPAGLAVAAVGIWLASYPALRSGTRAKVGDMLLPGSFRRLGRGAHRFAATLGSLLLTLLGLICVEALVPGASWWWAGAAAGVGTFTHSLGDALTRSGSPLWWPLRIRGCRWRSVGSPRAVRFTTGGVGEKVAVVLMLLAGAAVAYYLVVSAQSGTAA